MKKFNSEVGIFGMGCRIIIGIFLIVWVPVSFWTNRNLDFYVSLIKGHHVDVPMWISCVISLFEPVVLLDIIGELVRLVL